MIFSSALRRGVLGLFPLHEDSPHGVGGDLIKCIICMQTFEYLVDARKHAETHKRPFQCEYCHKKVSTKFGLEKHINKFHTDPIPSEDEGGAFECSTCIKSFRSSSILERHLIIHTRPYLKDESFRNYINDKEKLFEVKTGDGSSASTTFQEIDTTFIKVEKGIVKEEPEEYE
uniref:C2H2-type domain-containing protein n=1 Tax=Phlebotomus papatasi TaxID=29031 RepID=A0A1B0D9S8_PHLPP